MKVLQVLFGGILLLPTAAQADYVCQTSEALLKIQTFSLSEAVDEPGFFVSQPAVAFVKSPQGKMLFSGTVRSNPVRVGEQYGYALTSSDGEELHLTVQVYFSFAECTRAGCAEPTVTLSGRMTYAGENQAVTCEPSPF